MEKEVGMYFEVKRRINTRLHDPSWLFNIFDDKNIEGLNEVGDRGWGDFKNEERIQWEIKKLQLIEEAVLNGGYVWKDLAQDETISKSRKIR